MGSTQTGPWRLLLLAAAHLRDSLAESQSAVQRTPRSHSSASLRSRSAVALSCSARASLRYRIARALLMAILTQQNKDSRTGRRFRSGPRTGSAPATGRPDCFQKPARWTSQTRQAGVLISSVRRVRPLSVSRLRALRNNFRLHSFRSKSLKSEFSHAPTALTRNEHDYACVQIRH